MLSKKINVLIAGATGYVGLDLTLLLSKHKNINIKYLCAQKGIGKKISTFDKRIKTKLPKISNLTSVNYEELNLVFLSLPNGEAQMCAWCGNNRANVVFMPCGCVRYCTVCTATLAPGKCPTHGINNAGRVKLFFGSNEPS